MEETVIQVVQPEILVVKTNSFRAGRP